MNEGDDRLGLDLHHSYGRYCDRYYALLIPPMDATKELKSYRDLKSLNLAKHNS